MQGDAPGLGTAGGGGGDGGPGLALLLWLSQPWAASMLQPVRGAASALGTVGATLAARRSLGLSVWAADEGRARGLLLPTALSRRRLDVASR